MPLKGQISVAINRFLTRRFDGAASALADVWVRRAPRRGAFRGSSALGQPSFHFAEIPDHASGREGKAAGEFAALLHLVNGRVGKRHDLAQLAAADGPFDGLLGHRGHDGVSLLGV